MDEIMDYVQRGSAESSTMGILDGYDTAGFDEADLACLLEFAPVEEVARLELELEELDPEDDSGWTTQTSGLDSEQDGGTMLRGLDDVQQAVRRLANVFVACTVDVEPPWKRRRRDIEEERNEEIMFDFGGLSEDDIEAMLEMAPPEERNALQQAVDEGYEEDEEKEEQGQEGPDIELDSALSSPPSTAPSTPEAFKTSRSSSSGIPSPPTTPGHASPAPTPTPTKVQPSKPKRPKSSTTSPYFALHPTKSPYFPAAKSPSPRKPRRSPLQSCIPFPPLSAPTFGLIQETLAAHPFHLLLATTLLNRTRGLQAIPALHALITAFPTPASLAAASPAAITPLIAHLGLQNTRAARYVALARAWLETPPARGQRHRKLGYPAPGDGRDVRPGEVLADESEDPRTGAWEIAHLPTAGPYAIDSWRIFCRDVLRGVARGWNGEGAAECSVELEERKKSSEEEDAEKPTTHNPADINIDVDSHPPTNQPSISPSPIFEPEWKRVLPLDKELRAFLRWAWLREGWEWDPRTGKRTPASPALLERAARGGVVWEEDDVGGVWEGVDEPLARGDAASEEKMARGEGGGETQDGGLETRLESADGATANGGVHGPGVDAVGAAARAVARAVYGVVKELEGPGTQTEDQVMG